MDKYLTANEVATLVKLSLTTIRRLTMNNQIPYCKVNRSVRYISSEIETWMVERMKGRSSKNIEAEK